MAEKYETLILFKDIKCSRGRQSRTVWAAEKKNSTEDEILGVRK